MPPTESGVLNLCKLFRQHCQMSFRPEADDVLYFQIIKDCRLAPDDETLLQWFNEFRVQHAKDKYIRWDQFYAYMRGRHEHDTVRQRLPEKRKAPKPMTAEEHERVRRMLQRIKDRLAGKIVSKDDVPEDEIPF